MRFVLVLAVTIFTFNVAHSQTMVYVPDSVFRAFLHNLNLCITGDSLDVSCAKSNQGTLINFNAFKGIKSLSGLEHFHQLTMITATNDSITYLPELTHLTDLQHLNLHNLELDSLPDLSHNKRLRYISVAYNNLKYLPSLDSLVVLRELIARHNNLVELPSLANNVELEHLDVGSNELTQLPLLSSLSKLDRLNITYNKLTSLPSLNGCVKLRWLVATNNQLTSLPAFTYNTELVELTVNTNQLTLAPDLSANINLRTLNLGDNPMPVLPDLSNLDLSNLIVYSMGIDSIPDLSHMSRLRRLSCSYNKLKTLPDLHTNAFFEDLLCSHNQLTELPRLPNSTMRMLYASNNQLKTVPNFSTFSRFATDIRIDSNRLNFDHAAEMWSAAERLKTSSNAHLATFLYAPQLPFGDTVVSYLCEGDIMNLSIDSQKFATSYQWYFNGEPIPGQTDTFLNISSLDVSQSGEYFCVSYGDTLSQSKMLYGPGIDSFISAPFYITVLPVGTQLFVDAGNDTSVCLGQPFIFDGIGASSFQWLDEQGQVLANSSLLEGTASASSWFYFVTTDAGGCNQAMDSVYLNALPLPEVNLGNDTAHTGGGLILDAGNPGSTYLWNTGDTTRTITVDTDGAYFVTVTNEHGCTNTDTVNVSIVTSVEEAGIRGVSTTVYPNPFSGELNIELNLHGNSNIEIKMVDVLGRLHFF